MKKEFMTGFTTLRSTNGILIETKITKDDLEMYRKEYEEAVKLLNEGWTFNGVFGKDKTPKELNDNNTLYDYTIMTAHIVELERKDN